MRKIKSEKIVLRKEITEEDVYHLMAKEEQEQLEEFSLINNTIELMRKDTLEKNVVTIEVSGNLATYEEYDEFREQLKYYIENGKVDCFYIAFSSKHCLITSSVIGALVKIIFQHRIHIILQIRDEKLYEMLEDLHLIKVLNVELVR